MRLAVASAYRLLPYKYRLPRWYLGFPGRVMPLLHAANDDLISPGDAVVVGDPDCAALVEAHLGPGLLAVLAIKGDVAYLVAAADYTEAADDPESLAVWVDLGFRVYGVRASCLRRAIICCR